MASRYERIARAQQIIHDNPNVSKRGLQSQLKQEYGTGLADTTRRQLLQDANVPSVLRRRVSTLRREGVLNSREALTMRKAIHKAGTASYVKTVVNKLWQDGLAMHRDGLSGRAIRREFKQAAKDAGLIASRTTASRKKPDGNVKGEIDFWKMLRRQRDDDIKGGDYEPPKGSRGGKRPASQKGDVKAQKARYQDKQSTAAHARWVERERDRLQKWIDQKQRAIDVATSPARRRELTKERQTLERTLRGIR